MLKNYLKIAYRNIVRSKTYSIINILGLTIGVTCFLILTLFILNEISFDTYNENADRIYRIGVDTRIGNSETMNSKSPGPLAAALKRDFPEVESYTRIGYFGNRVFQYENKSFREWSIYWVDSTFFDIFSLTFVEGDPSTALTRPNTLVITESAAAKYFGDENPIGKILEADQMGGYLITGVIKDFPQNTHFSCQLLASISTYPVSDDELWLDLWYSTYVLLQEGTDIEAFQEKVSNTVPTYIGPAAEAAIGLPIEEFIKAGNYYGYFFQPMTSIYLYSKQFGIDPNTEWGNVKTSDINYVYIFSVVAIFLLLIAVINFMNLSTARSEKRAKEVGIRKTLGSNRTKLMSQFFIESILISAVSVVLALPIVGIILPFFNRLIGRELSLDLFSDIYIIPAIICFIILVGLLAGSYPALYLSSFKPMRILKQNFTKNNKKSSFRSALVIIQFAISVTLIAGTIIIKNQLDYMQEKNLGFKKEQLLIIQKPHIAGFMQGKVEAIKNEFLKNPNVLNVSNSSRLFENGIPGNGFIFNKRITTDPVEMQVVHTDYDFIETYQIELKDGRIFDREFSTDTSAVLVNEASLKFFGTDDVIGKELYRINTYGSADSYKIIGVIKDFNYESLHRKVRPLILKLSNNIDDASIFTVRVSSKNIPGTIEYLNTTWGKFSNGEKFYYSFVNEHLAHLYNNERRTNIIVSLFSVIAILIACLGLFGLVSFVTEQRTKEIGIRKVMGASVTEIILILSRKFAVWVLIANIIAWPIAYYVMSNWLENFAYRVNINWFVFILSGLSTLIIALATIGLHTVRAANANPIKSLRYE